jgi:uroporphyrin-III C-methyltransferase/precorrin-2 dehydrogenase/sirohydrochlorin ferrochelatase
MSDTLPIQLDLRGRPVLVLGAGPAALRKGRILAGAGAELRVIAEEGAGLAALLALPGARHLGRSLRASMLAGVAFVLAASGEPRLDRKAAALAARRGIPCNVVDDALHSSAHWPALLRRGPLAVAISSQGKTPALTGLLRAELMRRIGPEWGALAELLAGRVAQLRARLPSPGARRRFVAALRRGAVGEALRAGHHDRAAQLLDAALAGQGTGGSGSVVFVGAGPGDPELLTLAALRELEEADVILHDRLVPTAILELARPEAERIAVGRRCGEPLRAEPTAIQRMIALARRGSRVVRLKGGDPMLFARAAEELAALEEARIPYRIVPGVTAALACAARAGVPLTWRGRARSVLFATAHDARSIAALGRLGRGRADTLVIYMGRCRLRGLVETLIGAGWPAATPAVAVAGASLPGERVLLSSLAGLPDALSAPADAQPTTLIVGEVAALAARSARRSEATLGESARSAAARAAA